MIAINRLLDASLDVPARIEIFESDHPGAGEMLRAWAFEHSLTVALYVREPKAADEIGYTVLTCQVSIAFNHVITVYL